MLLEIQKYMKEALINYNIQDDLLNLISHDPVDKKELLKIYRNNILGSLTESLKITYPLFQYIVGSDSFKSIAKKYIKENLPSEGSLILWGKNFPIFINQLDELKQYAYLMDIASFDLAWHEAYHSQEDDAWDSERFSNLANQDQEFNFKLRNSVKIIQSKYPVDLIWQSYSKNKQLDDVIDMSSRGAKILIWRDGFEVLTQLLNDHEYIFLNQLIEKNPLDHVLKKLHENYGFSEQELSELFTKFLNLKIFKNVNNHDT